MRKSSVHALVTAAAIAGLATMATTSCVQHSDEPPNGDVGANGLTADGSIDATLPSTGVGPVGTGSDDATTGSLDATSDSGLTSTALYCDGGHVIHCAAEDGPSPDAFCPNGTTIHKWCVDDTPGRAVCNGHGINVPSQRYCCDDTNCVAPGYVCKATVINLTGRLPPPAGTITTVPGKCTFDEAAYDAYLDSGVDSAAPDAGRSTALYCDGGHIIHCGQQAGSPDVFCPNGSPGSAVHLACSDDADGRAICDSIGLSAPSKRYCCDDTNCLTPGYVCKPTVIDFTGRRPPPAGTITTVPGQCAFDQAAYDAYLDAGVDSSAPDSGLASALYCDGGHVIHCGSQGSGLPGDAFCPNGTTIHKYCVDETPGRAVCNGTGSQIPSNRYCCDDSNCVAAGYVCRPTVIDDTGRLSPPAGQATTVPGKCVLGP